MKAASRPYPSGTAAPEKSFNSRIFGWAALILFLILSVLFARSYDSRYVHFSNDGPLGAMVADQNLMPATFTGVWNDLNWLGSEGLSQSPAVTTFMRLLMSPLMYARILPPAALFIVGISACFCFRKFKLAPLACILGGLAAALNSDFLSTCTWGVASQIIGFGANYVALGLLVGNGSGARQWVRVVLAGMAVGVGIMEAYDIGALFSVFVAAYIFYDALFLNEGALPQRAGRGFLRVALVAGFAALISAHALTTLIGTQLEGVVIHQRDMQSEKQRWYFATQWSLPKVEALQIIVPGIFGYRMDSPNGDNYWGTIGSNPVLDDAAKLLDDPDEKVRAEARNMFGDIANWRISGTGYYAGVPVVLIALWAALQSFRRNGSPFSQPQRRTIWFWSAVAFISIPLAFGRYAPFYKLFYALPYGSAIRNPTKFLHVFNWALIILFAYGVHGLVETFFKNSATPERNFFAQLKNWRANASRFDRNFLLGCVFAIAAGLFGWAIYATPNVQANLIKYMEHVGIDPLIAVPDAKFSLHSVGWFVLLLAVSTILLAAIFSGQFGGARARWGAWLLGALVVFDLGRAGAPWIHYWNIDYKYASNPIIDLLRDKPYEHRVDIEPFGSQSDQLKIFRQVYAIEWTQQLFTYYDIQSLQVIMEPRVSVDKFKFLQALPWTDPANIVRTWELTNTRFLVGNGGDNFVNALNQKFDPLRRRFRLLTFLNGQPANFNLALKPGTKGSAYSDYSVVADPNGELGVVEFAGALPRAQLFSNWQVNTNDDDTLKLLASPTFDPHATVLVAATNFPAASATNASRYPGTVEIDPDYRAKRIALTADVQTPSVLLLNERFNPKWRVEVDGQPAPLLRCDYIMRGIYLTPGQHHIVMRFIQPLATLYVSLAAIAIGLALTVWLIFQEN